MSGEILIGPNAVPALAKEAYKYRDVKLNDLKEAISSKPIRMMVS